MWGDPKVCLKWIAQYTVWRTMYHWYMDMDDSGQHRKGFTPAMYAAGKDLSGELFEKAFEALLHKVFTPNISPAPAIPASRTG